ncbi:MAG: hypothetical protein NUW23_10245 [Firmicutes bacterium]|jgi:hypothetical protein|nr:hypothetical protein [Bacillota bacterium]
MNPGRKWIVAVLAMLVTLASGAAHASGPTTITVVDGTPVVFAGFEIWRAEDNGLRLSLDWVGISADLECMGVTFRTGGSINPTVFGEHEGSIPYTIGLGADWARMWSLVAAVQSSGILYLQDLGDGPAIAAVGRATGSTARIGLQTEAGYVPAGFDTTPARLIGRDYWLPGGVTDVAGRGWVDVTALLQSTRTRADSLRVAYSRLIGENEWRADVGYISRYRPAGLGVSIQLYSGIALGAPSVTLLSELTFRADVTDKSGAEIAIVAQGGGASEHAWLSGSGWVSLGENIELTVTISAPVVGAATYSGPELFRPIESADVCVGLDLAHGLLSSIKTRYDFKRQTLGLELSSRF